MCNAVGGQMANDGVLQANATKVLINDGEMLVNDGEISVGLYSFHLH